MSISYKGYGTGFPFPYRTKNELGLPIDPWNGYTYYEGIPSGSSSSFISVVEEWSKPYGFTLAELAKLFYRDKLFKADFTLYLNRSGGGYNSSFYLDSAYYVPEGIILGPQVISETLPTSVWGPTVCSEVTSEYQLLSEYRNFPEIRNTSVRIYSDWPEGLGSGYPYSDYEYSPTIGYWTSDDPGYPGGDMVGGVKLAVDFYDVWKSSNGLYYPSIFFGIAAFGSDMSFLPPFGIGAETFYTHDPGLIEIPFNLAGKSTHLSLVQGVAGGWGYPTTTEEDGGGSVTLSVVDTWPYSGRWNPADGIPT